MDKLSQNISDWAALVGLVISLGAIVGSAYSLFRLKASRKVFLRNKEAKEEEVTHPLTPDNNSLHTGSGDHLSVNLHSEDTHIKNQIRLHTKASERSLNDQSTIYKQAQFENEHLSNYYFQVLYQSKISFWFSLIFASLGFLMIILSIFVYKEGGIDKAILSLVSGLIIDAVSALFFVQSNKAQKAMGEFFEKLRMDKNNLESRTLCDSIEDKEARDLTKIQLILKLADVSNPSEVAQYIYGSRKQTVSSPENTTGS